MAQISIKYRKDVKRAMLSAAAIGPLGAFSGAVDMTSIATIWGILMVDIANKEGLSLDKKSAVKLATGMIIGASGYYAGCKAATRLFNFIPGAGNILAMGCSSVQNFVFTYYFALAIIAVFSAHRKEDMGDLVGAVVRVFKHFTPRDLGDMVALMLA